MRYISISEKRRKSFLVLTDKLLYEGKKERERVQGERNSTKKEVQKEMSYSETKEIHHQYFPPDKQRTRKVSPLLEISRNGKKMWYLRVSQNLAITRVSPKPLTFPSTSPPPSPSLPPLPTTSLLPSTPFPLPPTSSSPPPPLPTPEPG